MHYFPIFSKNNWKIDRPLARWHVGTFIGTLASKNEKSARFWHNGTWASGQVDHAGVHGTHGTHDTHDMRLNKLFLI